ncbi:MAG: DUF5714 domain-containing protein [Methanocorpusculum sp.]|nr:DUF5714 domain-containing protein [Methanocorpusculum sp.]
MYTRPTCPICGAVLDQMDFPKHGVCELCGKEYHSNYICPNGHRTCNPCRTKNAFEEAKKLCLETKSKNPIDIAEKIMNLPDFSVFGCRHYFVVPMALLTAFKNCGGKIRNFESVLDHILINTQLYPSSLCRIGGICGIPMCCGVCIRELDAKYFRDEKDLVKLENALSVRCMRSILKYYVIGNEGCCKDHIYACLYEGAKFLNDYFWIEVEMPEKIICKYWKHNPYDNCTDCHFYRGVKPVICEVVEKN